MRQMWPLAVLVTLFAGGVASAGTVPAPPDILFTYAGQSFTVVSGCSNEVNNRSSVALGIIEIMSQVGTSFSGTGSFGVILGNNLVTEELTLTGTIDDQGIMSGSVTTQAFLNGAPAGSRMSTFTGCTGGDQLENQPGDCAAIDRTNDNTVLTLSFAPGPLGADNCILESAEILVRTCGNGILDEDLGEQCDDANRVASDCCNRRCEVPRQPPLISFLPTLFDSTCPPEGIVSTTGDSGGNLLQSICSDDSEYQQRHVHPPSGFDGLISRSPYAGSLNSESVYVLSGFFGPTCAQEIFWRALEPQTLADPSGCEPSCSGDYCQGTCDTADWVTFFHDINRVELVCKHFTSPDGPGGANDQLVAEEMNCDPTQFPTPALARVTTADPMIPDTTFPCDVDRDGDCDDVDRALVVAGLGWCDDGGPFNELADTTHDGCITREDIDVLILAPEPGRVSLLVAALLTLRMRRRRRA